ncbi:MAG: hypothetical protein JXA04_03040 [Gammaproteobacteria bacterium]|nr:hypothetical protein [Gammaproteobacteria bacterium]
MKNHLLTAVILGFAFQLIFGCSPETDNNEKTKTIIDPQIQALNKAKQLEGDLQKVEQERAEKMREQGL